MLFNVCYFYKLKFLHPMEENVILLIEQYFKNSSFNIVIRLCLDMPFLFKYRMDLLPLWLCYIQIQNYFPYLKIILHFCYSLYISMINNWKDKAIFMFLWLIQRRNYFLTDWLHIVNAMKHIFITRCLRHEISLLVMLFHPILKIGWLWYKCYDLFILCISFLSMPW